MAHEWVHSSYSVYIGLRPNAALRPDVILMDMRMPKIDGLEATRRIRNLQGRQRTPIVAMTANVFAEDRTRCFQAGMTDFLMKPFAPAALPTVLLKCLDLQDQVTALVA